MAQPASAAEVKVTPLGLVAGEFCKLDRVMIFEDPNGTRILYEVAPKGGKVVAGTKTAKFIKATKVPVHLPLSERTMSFDAVRKCTYGC